MLKHSIRETQTEDVEKSFETMKKAHLTNKNRFPRTWKEVEKILITVKNCKANAKTVLHNAKIARRIFSKVYALTFSILKQNHILNAVIEEVHLLEKEPELRKELALIIVHELILGKGLPPGESKPILAVRKYQFEIQEAYLHLVEKGPSIHSGIYSIPKYVRVNTLVTTIPEVLEDLEYLGVEQVLYDDYISESDYLELVKKLREQTFLVDKHFKDLLVFHSNEKITQWSLYQKGHVLIQDKSSYIPPFVLSPEPGSVVLDACAAPGMKTLHLASIMEDKGILYAFERDQKRYKILEDMLQNQANIFQTFCCDFNSVDVYDEKFSSVEYILLDPSCSGSGMVNRMDSVTDTEESKSDLRIKNLAGFQIILLKHALQFPSVKRVVYSTCSTNEQENEYVVHEALNHFNYKFKLTEVLPDWPIRGSKDYEFGPLCLRAYPDKCLTNGFFVAMFERIDSFDKDDKFAYGKKTQKFKENFNKEIKNEKNNLSDESDLELFSKKREKKHDKTDIQANCEKLILDNETHNLDLEKNNEKINSNEKNNVSDKSVIELSRKKHKKKHDKTDIQTKYQVSLSIQESIQNTEEKNNLSDKSVVELCSKKRKRKHDKTDIQENCEELIQNNKIHSLDLEKNNKELNSNEKNNVSNTSIIELSTKKHKKKHDKFNIQANCEISLQNIEEKNNLSDKSAVELCLKKHKRKHDKMDIQANCEELIQNNKTHNLDLEKNNEELNSNEKNNVSDKSVIESFSKKHKKKRDKTDVQENFEKLTQNKEVYNLNLTTKNNEELNYNEKNNLSDRSDIELYSKKRKRKHEKTDNQKNYGESIQNKDELNFRHDTNNENNISLDSGAELHFKKHKKKHKHKKNI